MNKKRVFIIAEAGSNWKAGTPKQDLERGLALIDAASRAGADAVKFQTFRSETVYVTNAGESDYLSKSGLRKSITNIFKEMAMPYEMLPKLAAACKIKKIEFMSSFFSAEDFKAVDPHVRIHKIASYEISHPELLKLAARSKKTLILSTGAASLKDIDWALGVFKKNGGRKICLMQCTAKYPAGFSCLNLKAIPALADRYRIPVGLSDHSRDPLVAPVAATALGARLIEKHFTLSNKLSGPDHAFALEPMELKTMVVAVRAAESALGDGKKRVLPEEEELFQFAQRALQAVRGIKKGETISLKKNIGILRPGQQRKGAHPRFLKVLEGKKARRSIGLGQGVRLSDVTV